MGIRKVSMHEYTCDGCGKVQRGMLTEDVYGLEGMVSEYTKDGGTGKIAWFACSRDCVMPAINTMIKKAWEDPFE